MVLAVPRESWPGERRVAATPETVCEAGGDGVRRARRVRGRTARGLRRRGLWQGGRHRRGRRRCPVGLRRRAAEGAAAVRRRGRSTEGRRHAHQLLVARQEQGPDRPLGRPSGERDCHRSSAAHHAGAEDGRAVVDGQHRRLSRGGRSGELLRPLLHRSNDGGRTRASRQGAGDWRRRGGSGRDRRGPRHGRHRPRVRHAGGGEGPGQEHGRRVHRTQRRGRGRRRRWLRQGNEPSLHQSRDGDVRGAGPRGRHHHHDRAHPEPAGAGAHHGRHGEEHEARLGRRGPRRRERRQLRAHVARGRSSSTTA